MKKLTVVILLLCAVLFACAPNAEKSTKFERGVVENNVYKSNMLGIRFTPGPSCNFKAYSEILSMNGLDEGLVTDKEAAAEELGKLDTVFDMSAEDLRAGYSVEITFSNVKTLFGKDTITEEEYSEKLRAELDETYAGYGVQTSQDSASFAGKECTRVTSYLRINGQDVIQEYYIIKVEGYIASIGIKADGNVDISKDIVPLFEQITEE